MKNTEYIDDFDYSDSEDVRSYSRDHHITPQSGMDLINRFICAAYARKPNEAVYEVQQITPGFFDQYSREDD